MLDEFRAAHLDRPLSFESFGDTSGEWDAARLRQVVSNMVGNAIQYGGDATHAEVVARGEKSDVVFAVKNQGIPISSSALPTIFDPFVRAPEVTTKHRRREVGLGLYIAQQIVIAHGGTIVVTSDESTGTVFSVCLPRHPSLNRTATGGKLKAVRSRCGAAAQRTGRAGEPAALGSRTQKTGGGSWPPPAKQS